MKQRKFRIAEAALLEPSIGKLEPHGIISVVQRRRYVLRTLHDRPKLCQSPRRLHVVHGRGGFDERRIPPKPITVRLLLAEQPFGGPDTGVPETLIRFQ